MEPLMQEEDAIIQKLENIKAKWYFDMDFAADASSLYRLKGSPAVYDTNLDQSSVKWLRPHEFCDAPEYFGTGSGTGRVIPGSLDNAYFSSALAIITASPEPLIEDLFASGIDDFKRYGIYTCRFYKNGVWKDVVCDTRIPCVPSSEDPALFGPLYTKSLDPSEMFVPFLEKAYAKHHGSYESLSRGSIAEALVDLRGGTCTKIELSEKTGDEELWNRLRRSLKGNCVFGACISDTTKVIEEHPDSGLTKNLGYPVVECRTVKASTGEIKLVQLRNPWQDGSWEHEWGPESDMWDDYPEVASELLTEDLPEDSFWMSWTDFVDIFNKLYMCRLFPDDSFKEYVVEGEWVGKTSGGSCNWMSGMIASEISPEAEEKKTEEKKAEDIINALKTTTKVKKDYDAYWFNNPQYRVSTSARGKCISHSCSRTGD